MPYYTTDKSPDCPAWAVVKEDGEVVACHETEQSAIDQMIAVSLNERIEPGGTYTEQQRDSSEHESSKARSGQDSEGRNSEACQDCDGTCQVCRTRASRIEASQKEEVKGDIVSEIEQRVNVTEFEVREEGDGMHFSGYAALFDSPSEPLPFTERIAKGAFKRSLRSRNDIKFLWNHDAGEILGSTRARTLVLSEDDRGLKVEGMLPNTSRGRDVAELLRRGDVDAMSFGFSVPQGGDSWSNNGAERTLNSVRLHEVSIVAWPAYTATAGTVSVRKFEKTAQRADVNAEALADALSKIEDGLNITSDEKEMLSRVISTLAPEPEAEVVAETEVELEAEQEPTGDLAMLELKKKKLQLLDRK